MPRSGIAETPSDISRLWVVHDGEHIIYVNGTDRDSKTELGKMMHEKRFWK